MNHKYNYFFGKEADQFTFFKIPKILIDDKELRKMGNDAKMLYGLCLDRMSLSQKNEWIDKDNHVYIIFSIEDIEETLNISEKKAMKAKAELVRYGLIKVRKRGLGLPDLIFVMNAYSELSSDEPKIMQETKTEEQLGISRGTNNDTSRGVENSTSRGAKSEMSRSAKNDTQIRSTAKKTKSNKTYVSKEEEVPASETEQRVWELTDFAFFRANGVAPPDAPAPQKRRALEDYTAVVQGITDLLTKPFPVGEIRSDLFEATVKDIVAECGNLVDFCHAAAHQYRARKDDNSQPPVRNARNYVQVLLTNFAPKFLCQLREELSA